MERVAVIGNSSGGKSMIARKLAARRGLPHVELDLLRFRPGRVATPVEAYEAEHARLIAQDSWIADGLGRLESMPARFARATEIILIDMPIWLNYWLAAERQIAWFTGKLEYPPGGATEPPPTKALFRTIAEVDRDWMPEIRRLAAAEEARGKPVRHLCEFDEVRAFAAAL